MRQRGAEGSVWRVCVRAGPAAAGEYGVPRLADGTTALPPARPSLSAARKLGARKSLSDGERFSLSVGALVGDYLPPRCEKISLRWWEIISPDR